MINGTAYGVVLNDRAERDDLADALGAAPYGAPPRSPVVYIKPRNCFASSGAPVMLDGDVDELVAAGTIGLLFGRDVTGGGFDPSAVAGVCLALDLSVPKADYYRPAISERCRDGFLPLGRWGQAAAPGAPIVTSVNGEERHRWSMERLLRPIPELVTALAEFMTLRAGDLLLVGVAGDAPRARAGDAISVTMAGLPALDTTLTGATA